MSEYEILSGDEILARIKQLDVEIKETECARGCLASNGCYVAVNNADEKLKRLYVERQGLGRMQPRKQVRT